MEIVGLGKVKWEVVGVGGRGKRNEGWYDLVVVDCGGIREEREVVVREVKIYDVGCRVMGNVREEDWEVG